MAVGPYSDTKIALTHLYGILIWGCIVFAFQDLWPRLLQIKIPIALALSLLAVSWLSQRFALDPTASIHHPNVASFGPSGLVPQIGLFLGVSLFLRSPGQLQRLAKAMTVTSFAVALVAAPEAFGLGNPDHGEDPPWAVVSFVGSGLSVGSYLVFCLPFSVWWFWCQLQKAGSRITIPVLLGALVVFVQMSAIFAANKRGPLVSLVVTAILTVILLQRSRATLSMALRMAVVGLVIAGTLTAMAFYGRSDPGFRKTPVLGKLSMVVPVGDGTGDASRDRIWRAATDIFTKKIPVTRPDGEPDQFSPLRPWLGLGPDSAVIALAAGYLMLGRWPSSVLEMSTHNVLLDIILTLGATGLLVFCALFVAVLTAGWRQLSGQSCSCWKTWAIGIVTVLFVAVTTSLVWGRSFFVMGLQFGILACFGLLALLGDRRSPAAGREANCQKLYIALLVAVAGYWTYLCFMFPTTEGLALFFIASGAIVGFAGESPPQQGGSSQPTCAVPQTSDFIWSSYIGSLVLLSIIASRFSIFPILSGKVEPYALFTDSIANAVMVVSVLLVMWAANAAIWLGDVSSKRTVHRGLQITGITIIAVLVYFLLFAKSAQRMPIAWLADITAAQVFLAPLVALIVVGAITFRQSPQAARLRTVFTSVCVVIALAYLLAPVVNDFRAALAAGYLKRFNLPHDHLLATRMLALAPASMRYRELRLQLLDSALRQTTPYSAAWLDLHDAKKQTLEEANKHSNFSLIPAHLGRVYLEKYEMTQCHPERERLLQNASFSLRSTLNFMPSNEMALVDLAFVHSERRKMQESSKCLAKADAITGSSAVTVEGVNHLGWWTYYYDLVLKTRGKPRRTIYAQRALKYIDRQLEELDAFIVASATNPSIIPRALRKKGWLHSARGKVLVLTDQADRATLDFALAGYFWAFSPKAETMKMTANHVVELSMLRSNSNCSSLMP